MANGVGYGAPFLAGAVASDPVARWPDRLTASGHRRSFHKKKSSSSGQTEIAGGARTDKADAKFESESPHQSYSMRASKPGAVDIDPIAARRRRARVAPLPARASELTTRPAPRARGDFPANEVNGDWWRAAAPRRDRR
jgi:hypothetical protein